MNKTILIVDDNEGDRALIKETLEDAQINVNLIEATTGDEGIQLAKNEKPDLILMDVMMPGMNGGDAVKFLKADKRTDHIPVVFLTGVYSKKDEENQGKINIEEEFYDSIAKPVDETKLISVINKYVKEN
jgi:CheY-like chemotaxis protein